VKRFTETLKWSDPWFRRLSAPAKLLWFYAIDHCDNIGIVELDFGFVSNDCCFKVTEAHATELGERLQAIGQGRYFIPKFIQFQYGKLSPSCRPHEKVIEAVNYHSLILTPQGYRYPLDRVSDRVSENQDRVSGIADTPKEQDRKSTGRRQEEDSTRKRATFPEIIDLCKEVGLFPRDAEYVFHKWEGNGWTNGSKPIKDWKATVRSWKSAGFFPSQKAPSPDDHWPEPKREREPEPDLMAVLQENIAKRKAHEAEENAAPESEADPSWS
jgi:hypothetical protein